MNDVVEVHWKQARDLIIRAKPYWAAFNASSYIKELTVGNIWLVHGYSNDIFQADLDAQKANRKFRIISSIPKEGAVLALDSMVLHKTGLHPDLSHRFINFMLDGRNSAKLTNLIGSGNLTKPSCISQSRATSSAGNATRSESPSASHTVTHLDPD